MPAKKTALLGLGLVLSFLSTASCQPSLGGWREVQLESGSTELKSRLLRSAATDEAVDLVWAELNGRGGWFALDTGASFSVLDDDFADALNLPRGQTIRVETCQLPVTFRSADTFRVGPLRYTDPLFVSLDLDPLLSEAKSEVKLDGIIGYPLFEHAIFEIQYGADRDRIFVHDPEGYALPAGEWTSIRMVGDRPHIRGSADGYEADFLIDTGKSSTVSFSTHFHERYPLFEEADAVERSNRGVCGVSKEWSAAIDRMEIGGQVIEQPVVQFRIPGTIAAKKKRREDGVLGREMLKDFTLVLDYRSRRVALVAR